METKIQVLIADSNIDYRRLVANRLQDELDLELVGSTADGLEALQLVRERRPDIVVLDVLLEKLDGLGLLRRIGEMELRTSCIVASASNQDSMISEAFHLGADYFLHKPFGTETLLEKIRHVAKRRHLALLRDVGQLEFKITAILRELGSPAYMKGYPYLRYGIVLVVLDVRLLDAVTGELYPAIGEKFDVPGSQVERCIRNVIETTWKHGDRQVFQKFFGSTVANRSGQPTNSAFIATLADQLRLQRSYGNGPNK